jgi:hypothetical protein
MVNDRRVINGQSLSRFSVAALGYPARRRDRLTPKEAAHNLLEELLVEAEANNYQEIYFIAHSLGGIVVKQMILDALDRSPLFAQRIRAVIFVSVPSSTARFQSMLSRLPLADAMAGPIIRYFLTPGGTQYLQELDNSWSYLIADGNEKAHVAQHCAYETRPVGLPPFTAVVVPQSQSENQCASKFVANNENHVSIIKATLDSPIHSWARNQILSASGAAPITPWVPVPRPECKRYPKGMLFTVGGYGALRRLSFLAAVEADICDTSIVARVVERGNPIIFGGNTGDACSGHLQYNSLVAGVNLTIPRSCVNDAGR